MLQVLAVHTDTHLLVQDNPTLPAGLLYLLPDTNLAEHRLVSTGLLVLFSLSVKYYKC